MVSMNTIYSARMTGNQFLYPEFKVMCELLQKGLSKKEATDLIIEQNLFGYRSFKAIGKHISAVWERANYLDDYLRNVVLTEPNEIGRLVNFYSILKYDLLFFEFIRDVIGEKVYKHQLEINKSDIAVYFEEKAEQSEIVAGFKQSTINRLKLAYCEILQGGGYISEIDKTMKLSVPSIQIYRFSEHLEEIGEKDYLRVMLGE